MSAFVRHRAISVVYLLFRKPSVWPFGPPPLGPHTPPPILRINHTRIAAIVSDSFGFSALNVTLISFGRAYLKMPYVAAIRRSHEYEIDLYLTARDAQRPDTISVISFDPNESEWS